MIWDHNCFFYRTDITLFTGFEVYTNLIQEARGYTCKI